jgi:hypothetical protein
MRQFKYPERIENIFSQYGVEPNAFQIFFLCIEGTQLLEIEEAFDHPFLRLNLKDYFKKIDIAKSIFNSIDLEIIKDNYIELVNFMENDLSDLKKWLK